ncbi:MAG: AzlD domain-containing protein [Anaerolineales bacterium]|nr:MAG: AzlD domain-containing protein [Anaerolineales bacterium]
MDQKTIFLTILGMAVVTYIPRLLPVSLLSSRSLPPLIFDWLRYVPVAVLSAMLFPSIILQGHQVTFGLDNLFFWAAIPTLLVALKTRSLFGSVVVGMMVVAVARYISG